MLRRLALALGLTLVSTFALAQSAPPPVAAAAAVDDRVALDTGKSPASSPQIYGRIRFVLTDAKGVVWVDRTIRNLVTDAGKAGIASRINGSGAEAAFGHIAIGTGTTAAAAGDTTLQTEISTNGGQRAACTASRITTDVTNDTAQCVVTFNFTGSFAVTESGYLNAASSGVLAARQTFSAINVVNGDSLQVTWRLDVD